LRLATTTIPSGKRLLRVSIVVGNTRRSWEEVMGSKSSTGDNILMSIVGIAFFLNILLLSNVVMDIGPASEELVILGWALLLIGASLVVLSVLSLRRYGTSSLNKNGIYGIVRHPMYVGGLVMFLSHPCFGQDWVVAVSAFVGVCCCYLLMTSEDRRLVDGFGEEYRQYMQEVPGLNFLAGAIRVIRRRTATRT
jgi:protein-S-isoprenylcysteine O-methyltransferase Ste14